MFPLDFFDTSITSLFASSVVGLPDKKERKKEKSKERRHREDTSGQPKENSSVADPVLVSGGKSKPKQEEEERGWEREKKKAKRKQTRKMQIGVRVGEQDTRKKKTITRHCQGVLLHDGEDASPKGKK